MGAQLASPKLQNPVSFLFWLFGCGCSYSKQWLYEYWSYFSELCVGFHQELVGSGLWACQFAKIQISFESSVFGLYTMDHCDLQELRRILRAHEEMIQGNRTSIFSLTSKCMIMNSNVSLKLQRL